MSLPIRVIASFAGQNWLITPAAQALNEAPPSDIHAQRWLLTLSGVGLVGLQGNSASEWLQETLLLEPTVLDPMHYAIAHHAIPAPSGTEGDQYSLAFQVEQLAPFASVSSMYNAGESINSGFAVDTWRPNHWGSGIDAFTHQYVSTLFSGLQVDVAVRDTDAYLYRVGYDIALLGKIVFVAAQEILFESNFDQTAIDQPPSPTQQVGTAKVEPPGNVTVFNPPVLSTENWVLLGKRKRGTKDGVDPTYADGAYWDCYLTETPGPGVYLFSAELFLPLPDAEGVNNVASISFETAAGDEFMHVDFLPNNRARVDDIGDEFGSFPRGAGFLVQVALNTETSPATAKVVLTGAASGSQDATVKPPWQQWAPEFGAVKLWQGVGDTGGFWATNIVVTQTAD